MLIGARLYIINAQVWVLRLAPLSTEFTGAIHYREGPRVWEIGNVDAELQVFERCARECVTGAARSPDFFIIVSHRKRLLSAREG